VAVGKIGHGRVLAARGAHDTGLAAIREGIAEHHAVGQLLAQPMQLAMLAEALADADRRGEALATIAEARARIDMTGDVRYLAELHRLEGELRAHAEEPAAEGCFERAIAIAREQGSRWWELRARTTLVEWRRAHRKPVDQAEFATFVAAFGEGEATVDVRAARRAASA
jgi:predicted ATPase